MISPNETNPIAFIVLFIFSDLFVEHYLWNN